MAEQTGRSLAGPSEESSPAPRQSPFRKEALEYTTTPKPLEDLTQMTFPLVWLPAVALFLGIAALTVWLSFGSIATYTDGKGVLHRQTPWSLIMSCLRDK